MPAWPSSQTRSAGKMLFCNLMFQGITADPNMLLHLHSPSRLPYTAAFILPYPGCNYEMIAEIKSYLHVETRASLFSEKGDCGNMSMPLLRRYGLQ